MKNKLLLIFLTLFQLNLFAQIPNQVVEVRKKFDEKNLATAKEDLIKDALKELIKREVKLKNLDLTLFQPTLDSNFDLNKLPPIIKSYEVVDFSREATDTSVRVLTLRGELNLNEITQTNPANSDLTKNIYLKVDYDLQNLTWQDLGVAFKDEMTKTLEKSWLKWFSELNPQFSNLKIYNQEKEGTLILATLRLSKINFQNEQNSNLFIDYKGGFVILSLQNHNALQSNKFEEKEDRYNLNNRSELSTSIANFMYRYPLTAFASLKNFSAPVSLTNKEIVSYFQFSKPEDVFYFISQVETKGNSLGVDAKLLNLKIGEAQIELSFKGDKEQVKNFLKDLTDEHFTVSKNNPFEVYAQKKEIK